MTAPAGDGDGTPATSGEIACNGTLDVPATPLRRLTTQEYVNAARDLFGDGIPELDDIPADESVGPFASNAVAPITDLSTEQYLGAAEALARHAVANIDALLSCDRAALGESACAAQFVQEFGARAFRRPLDGEEQARYQALYAEYAAKGGLSNGIRVVVQALLQSPHYLYHVEFNTPAPAGQAIVPLSGHEVASRLSFFLWKSVPDRALFDAATSGALASPEGLRQQAERMLADPRAHGAATRFFTDWLELSKLSYIEKDATLYPAFDDELRAAMTAETKHFVEHVLWNGDGRMQTLLAAPFSVLDGPLFELYGVTRPAGTSGPVRVDLDPAQRAGLLTQAAFLATHAHENQTSPVARGVSIRRNVLCDALPDPPANVNNQPPEPRPGATTRERFATHVEDPACAGCHNLIDPIGLGFEAYDALGRYRTTEQGLPIDVSGEVTNTSIGGTFNGAIELAARLAGSSEVEACMARQWFRYALGRFETVADGCSLERAIQNFSGSRHDVRELLAAIVSSDAFRYRRVEVVK